MLVLMREAGSSVSIEDITFTIIALGDGVADVSLAKPKSERPKVITLIRGETVEICYGVTVVLIKVSDKSVRLGFECPREISIVRSEHVPE